MLKLGHMDINFLKPKVFFMSIFSVSTIVPLCSFYFKTIHINSEAIFPLSPDDDVLLEFLLVVLLMICALS